MRKYEWPFMIKLYRKRNSSDNSRHRSPSQRHPIYTLHSLQHHRQLPPHSPWGRWLRRERGSACPEDTGGTRVGDCRGGEGCYSSWVATEGANQEREDSASEESEKDEVLVSEGEKLEEVDGSAFGKLMTSSQYACGFSSAWSQR